MKKILLAIFLIPLFVTAQNPYPVSCISYNSAGDTIITTTSVYGTAKTFGRKVTQTPTITTVIHPFKPVIQVNLPPIVTGGNDITITLPVNQVTLSAQVSDPDGGITSIVWDKLSGSTATIAGGNPTLITGLVEGAYAFRVTATDNQGATASDQVTVTVLPAVVINPPPPIGTNADPTTPPKMFNDFETSATAGFNSYIQQAQTGLVVLSTDQKVSGSKSIKFTVIQALAQSTGESHSQLTKIDVESLKEGDERWYSSDYYLPSPYPTDIQYLRQWHHDASNYSPPAALCTQGGKLQWDQFTEYGGNGHDIFTDIAAYPLDKWFHVTIHMIFSSDPAKALNEVWVDGVKKMTLKAINKYPGINDIAMFGLYKWVYKIPGYSPSASTTIYADNYKEW